MENNYVLSIFDVLLEEVNANILAYLNRNAVNNLAATCKNWQKIIATFDIKRRGEVIKNIDVAIAQNLLRTAPNSSCIITSFCCSLLVGIVGVFGLSSTLHENSNEKSKILFVGLGIFFIFIIALIAVNV